MKKLLFLAAFAALTMSCAPTSKLITTSTSNNVSSEMQTTVTIADVKVSEKKISYVYIPSRTVLAGGYDNIIKTAVREALLYAGEQYDVLMAMQTQIKYSEEGEIESVNVTGYPGTYVNWRSSKEISRPEPEKGSSLIPTPQK